jgi:NAD(P)-dependent dehydrogenase (short-subunit alcohol dehydrogenase family)
VIFPDLDVTSDESVTALVRQGDPAIRADRRPGQQCRHRSGRSGRGKLDSAGPDIFEVNVFGVIRMTNAVLPHLRAQGSGRTINISSVLGLIPQPYGRVRLLQVGDRGLFRITRPAANKHTTSYANYTATRNSNACGPAGSMSPTAEIPTT